MKKGYFFLGVLIAVGVLIGNVYKQNDKEFEILNSYKVSTDNFQSVTLQVVVYAWNYDEEEMLCKVRDFYEKTDGKADILRVVLYDVRQNFYNAKYQVERIFVS